MQVLLTALDRDSWGRVFPVVERLRAIAHLVREMTTFCARCGGLAERTQRLTPILDRSMVGGPESYEPRCLQCWKPPPEFPID
jgi:thymidine kinase